MIKKIVICKLTIDWFYTTVCQWRDRIRSSLINAKNLAVDRVDTHDLVPLHEYQIVDQIGNKYMNIEYICS